MKFSVIVCSILKGKLCAILPFWNLGFHIPSDCKWSSLLVNFCYFSGCSVSPKRLLSLRGQRSDCILLQRLHPTPALGVKFKFIMTFVHRFQLKEFLVIFVLFLSAFEAHVKIKLTSTLVVGWGHVTNSGQ